MPGSAGGKSHYLWSGSSFVRLSKECQTGGLWVKKNELAGDVPAYKVVNSQGVLSGAASFEHPDLQRMLLEEGIEVSMDNKVDLKKYGWKNSLEDAEFFRETFRRKGI